ncbi:hypothetical protein EDD18DRAFT_44495 [Armillaria luteobubalina]|uniref:Uncharacterized protein n=1 Tax=Armillaria luteobubalina TaxID=153913 RepID=A0AA39V131_9AGAR|nr:hypothetical protein EDD18DRAFT_44495 [Armillaria luteobubalina]
MARHKLQTSHGCTGSAHEYMEFIACSWLCDIINASISIGRDGVVIGLTSLLGLTLRSNRCCLSQRRRYESGCTATNAVFTHFSTPVVIPSCTNTPFPQTAFAAKPFDEHPCQVGPPRNHALLVIVASKNCMRGIGNGRRTRTGSSVTVGAARSQMPLCMGGRVYSFS